MSLRRVLVANRGEIAVRIVNACHALGLEAVVVVSEADRNSRAAQLADRAVCVGPASARASYLSQDALLATALGTGADAIHPGYGFLAENATFAEKCAQNDITFVGPSAATIGTMGDKLAAREAAHRLGVPVVPGSPEIRTIDDAATIIEAIGYPAIIKASAGGGGRGIRVVADATDLTSTFQSAAAEAESAFGDGRLYVERYVPRARHIEVQVLADHDGEVVHLGDRDCSMQRRYQKVIEEAPAPRLSEEMRSAIRASALVLASGISYQNAGTVEFLLDEDRDEYYFLEMNTRIQVEHPVTEVITSQDLVQHQLRIASGEPLGLKQEDITFSGHAVECRVTAESARHGFRPSPGTIRSWDPPNGSGVRIDTHCYSGYVIPPHYDSLLAKLICYGSDRADALQRTGVALENFHVEGVDTNIDLLAFLVNLPEFQDGGFDTKLIERVLPLFTAGSP